MSFGCYESMFRDCTNLKKAPQLPATSLSLQCYAYMFLGCTSLTDAPELPASELEPNCYRFMFFGCTSLTDAPELPAHELKYRCYDCMFSGCSSLEYIKCLATDISALACTYNWLAGVKPTGTFIIGGEAPNWGRGDSGIPSGWSVMIDGD